MSEDFVGPVELADAIIDCRYKEWAVNEEDQKHVKAVFFANMSDVGLRRFIQIAFFASQELNEGRPPRLTLFVPSERGMVNVIVKMDETLDRKTLSRIAPVVGSDNAFLIVERQGELRIEGIIVFRGVLSNASNLTEESEQFNRPTGLSVEILGPGDIRAGERLMHRLRCGEFHAEVSFSSEIWFQEWRQEAANIAEEGDQGNSCKACTPRFYIRFFGRPRHFVTVLVS